MPLATAEWLERQMTTGRVTLSSNQSICPFHSLIVVATGPEFRVTKSRNPLLRYLLDSGQAKPHMAGNTELGGLAMTNFQIDGLPGVFGMGALARGQYFAVHSFPALVAHADAIVVGDSVSKKEHENVFVIGGPSPSASYQFNIEAST